MPGKKTPRACCATTSWRGGHRTALALPRRMKAMFGCCSDRLGWAGVRYGKHVDLICVGNRMKEAKRWNLNLHISPMAVPILSFRIGPVNLGSQTLLSYQCWLRWDMSRGQEQRRYFEWSEHACACRRDGWMDMHAPAASIVVVRGRRIT